MFCIFSYCSAYIIRLHEIYTYKTIKSILGSQNMIEKGKNSLKKKNHLLLLRWHGKWYKTWKKIESIVKNVKIFFSKQNKRIGKIHLPTI